MCIHCQQLKCNTEYEEIGNRNGETVRDKGKSGRVDKNRRAQEHFQDHKQGRTGLEICCECNRSMASDTLIRRASMIHAYLVFSRSDLCAAGLRVHIGNFARQGGFQRHFRLLHALFMVSQKAISSELI